MRIAIITDIHEDIVSLSEAFRKIDKLKCDEIICLGDISGYSAPYYRYVPLRNAHECLKLIRENCTHIVLGNHDIHAAQKLPENCSFFKYPNNWYELDYQERHKLAKDILWFHEEDDLNPLYTAEDVAFLNSLPEYITLEYQGLKTMFSHYVYPNLIGLKREFYTYKDEFRQHFKFMEEQNCSISFTGHSHVKGFFIAKGSSYKQYGFKSATLTNEPICIGIPPVTALNKKSGFCTFDTGTRLIQAFRL